jgi:hypothetical protein
MKRVWLILAAALTLAAAAAQDGTALRMPNEQGAVPPPDRVMHVVKPSVTDPRIAQFDNENVVMFNRSSGAHPPLAIFMTGTGGRPVGAQRILSVIANQGYRAIGLAYNDEPAVMQICPRLPDPQCAGKYRYKRIFGTDTTDVIQDSPNEAIIPRLMSLLAWLDKQYPDEHWASYIAGGEPDWSQVVVSGQSQGAGMAAYIAKKRLVQRVVLFSSPWDSYGRNSTLAPWLDDPSATPMDRWFAEYHAKENTAELLVKAYKRLGIADDHVRVFHGEPKVMKGENPYHATTAQLPQYIPDWQAMYGKAQN